LRAETLAVFAADYFQRQREQNLLAQNDLQQNSLAFIIADLRLGIGDGKLVPSGIGPERTIQQFKLPDDILCYRLKAARTTLLQSCAKSAPEANVFYYLMLAVMLFDDFGASASIEGRALAEIATQIDDIRLELLRKVDRMEV